MEQIVNQYSALWIGGAFVFLIALILFQRKPKPGDFIALSVVVIGLVLAWILLHPTQTPLMGDARTVQSMIGQGEPVLLEFQSPYCIACTKMKPVVDDLENELGDQLLILRLNVQADVGHELAPVYGFEFTPTFIYFDGEGHELWRDVGGLDPQRVRDSLP
jgi:thioredoxin